MPTRVAASRHPFIGCVELAVNAKPPPPGKLLSLRQQDLVNDFKRALEDAPAAAWQSPCSGRALRSSCISPSVVCDRSKQRHCPTTQNVLNAENVPVGTDDEARPRLSQCRWLSNLSCGVLNLADFGEYVARLSNGDTSMKNLELSGRSVLLVEDEPLIALDLRQTLENAGAYVFAATKLPHALQLAAHPDLSAAVLDYRIGHEDSAAICSLLEQRCIPFVFYSGYDDMRRRWPNAVHVPKPADERRLIEAVAGALGSYATAA